MIIDLTPEQRDVEDQIFDFIDSNWKDQYFVLHGLAGTGKTTLMAHLARRRPRAMVPCAFTGKAASVLRKKIGMEVSTVHQVIFNFKGLVENRLDPRRMDPIFEEKHVDLDGHVVLLDECSLIGSRIAKDLLNTGAKVVACGDPGQLPPVMDSGFFVDPHAELM